MIKSDKRYSNKQKKLLLWDKMFKTSDKCETLISLGPFPYGKRMGKNYCHLETKHKSPGHVIWK